MKKWNYGLFCLCTAVLVVLSVYWGSRAVTVISDQLSDAGRCRIIIDPGHGGEDGGAASCTGRPESGYNLQISLRLNDLLNLLGHETRMIRREDVSVYTTGDTIAQKKVSDLKARVRAVNEAENAVLVSIHQNQFPDSRYSGAQVFYAKTEGSQKLAAQLQSSLVESLNPGSRRQCKAGSGIYLLEHIQCPGVLVECGFLSNPREEALLRNSDYQKKLCCVIAAQLNRYLAGREVTASS